MDAPATDLRFTRTLCGSTMWLTAGRRVSFSVGSLRIFGHIPETSLGPQSQWRRFTGEQRDAAEHAVLQTHGAKLEQALEAAVAEIAAYLQACEADALQPDIPQLRDHWASGEMDLGRVGSVLRQSLLDMQSNRRHRNLAEQIGTR